MAAAGFIDGQAVLALASALALVVLGAALLRTQRWGGPAFLLGLLATCWGLQVATVRLSFAVEPPWIRTLVLLSHAFALPLYLFLLQFAVTYPTPLAVSRARWWVPVASLPAVAALALSVLDLSSAVAAGGAGGGTVWGPGAILLVFLPLLGAQLLVLLRASLGVLRERGGAREQRSWLALGLLLYLAHSAPYFLVNVAALAPAFGGANALWWTYAAGVAAASVLALGLGAVLAVKDRPWRLVWAAATVLPALSALPLGSRLDLLGLWRLVAVLVLAYGVARYQLFDLDLRLRSWAAPALAAAVALVAWGGAAALSPGPFVLQDPAAVAQFASFAVVGAVVGVLLLRPLRGVIDRLFPYVRATEEYLLRRKLEVYRAAYARSLPLRSLDHLARDLRLRPWQRRSALLGASPPSEALGPDAVLAGRYKVERFLGSGLHGRLFLADDLRLGGKVVLKEYAGFAGEGAAEAFLREAKILGEVESPHVVAVRDVQRLGEDLYVVLEHAPDGTLEDLLQRRPTLPPDEALAIAEAVVQGLSAAHARGVVHRDVKPANILFRGARPQLADFGVAFDPVLDGALRGLGGQPGTLAWMAPEQARGEAPSPATDVWAAGAVLYRMLAGRPPVAVADLGERAARRRLARPPRPPPLPEGVPPGLRRVLDRALAADPTERYPDAAAMLRDLRAARSAAS